MKAHAPVIASILGLLALSACGPSEEDPEVVHRVIGAGGGLLTSADSVLTIAIPPGALETEVDLYIERTEEPPAVFGQAYLVRPNPELHFDMTVSYRGELPDDLTEVAVGAIDAEAYGQGKGRWHALPVLRVEEEDKLVTGLDDGVSVFYALLDEGGGQAPGDGSSSGE